MPWARYVNGSDVEPVIVPEQLSVVVAIIAVAEQSPVTSANPGSTGEIVSITVTIATQFDELELPSDTVKITLTGPRSAHVNAV